MEITQTGIHFIPLTDKTWYGAFFEVVKFLFSLEETKIREEEKKKEEDTRAKIKILEIKLKK